MNKTFLGYLSVVITLTGYAIYIGSMYRTASSDRQIKPHPLSWVLFGFLTVVGWFTQLTQGGYAGSWCLGVTGLFCFIIAVLSYKRYVWHFERTDWMCVIMGMGLFIFSILMKTPVLSVTLALLADLAGYGPTLRKGWHEPYTDNPMNFGLNSVKCIPAIFALSSYSWATYSYLAMLIVMNGGVATMLVLRRLRVNDRLA